MSRIASAALCMGVLALGACAVPPPAGPSVMALPGQGKTFGGLSGGRCCVPPVRRAANGRCLARYGCHQQRCRQRCRRYRARCGRRCSDRRRQRRGGAGCGDWGRSRPSDGKLGRREQCRCCLWWNTAVLRRELYAVHDRPRRHCAAPASRLCRLRLSPVSVSRLPVSISTLSVWLLRRVFGPVSHDRLRRRMGMAWRRVAWRWMARRWLAPLIATRASPLASHCRASAYALASLRRVFAPQPVP